MHKSNRRGPLALFAGVATRPVAAAPHVDRITYLAGSFGLAALATVIYLVALRFLVIVRHAALVRLRAFGSKKLRAVAIAGYTLFTREQIAVLLKRLVELAAWAVGLIATYIWISFVFSRFALS